MNIFLMILLLLHCIPTICMDTTLSKSHESSPAKNLHEQVFVYLGPEYNHQSAESFNVNSTVNHSAQRVETPYFMTDQHATAPRSRISSYASENMHTINAACTSQYSSSPDPLKVALHVLQINGDVKRIEALKVELEKKLETKIFGKRAITTQLEKVQRILSDPMTQRLHIIRDGTFDQALKAIKEIRRLSPFKHVGTDQLYRSRLGVYMKAVGYNQLQAAENLLVSRDDYQKMIHESGCLIVGAGDSVSIRTTGTPKSFGFDVPSTEQIDAILVKREIAQKITAEKGAVLENVTLDDNAARIYQANSSEVTPSVLTDMVPTTPTDADLVQKHLAKQISDRDVRLNQLHELLSEAAQTGAMTVERYVSITYAFLVEGALVDTAAGAANTVLHPIQTVQNIAEGAVQLADAIGPFMVDVFSAPDGEFPTAAEMQAHQERLQARAESMSKTYAACMEHIAGLTPEQKARFLGSVAGQIFLCKYGVPLAGKAAEGGVLFIGISLNETPFLQEFMGHLSRGAQVALPEGGAVSMPAAAKTAAEIAADAKAAAETVQAVAQGATAASATNTLLNEAQKVRSGGDSGSHLAKFDEISATAKELHPELDRNMSEVERLHEQVNQASSLSCKEQVSGKVNSATQAHEYMRMEEEAVHFYQKMRSSDQDIIAIAENTGISPDYIRKIKSHLFMEEHILHEGVISRFSPDIDMAAAWDRLLKNRFTDSDLLLLKHEYAEACIMRGVQVSWEEAHPLANQIYNWQASLKG